MRQPANGFTVAELLVVMAIGAMIAGIGFATIDVASWRANAAATVMARQLDQARSKAAFEQNLYVVTFDTSMSVIEILDDDNSNGSYTAALREKVTRFGLGAEMRSVTLGYVPGAKGLDGNPINAAVTFPGTPKTVTFDPLGRAQSGTIYLTPEEDLVGGDASHMRALTVSAATGRIRRWRYDAGSSSPGPWRLER